MKVDFIPQQEFDNYLERLIQQSLQEDIGNGDHTSLSTISADIFEKAHLKVKDEGVLAGIELAKKIFHHINPVLDFKPFMKDGDKAGFGDIAFEVSGSARDILQGERLALNFMQRLSGIASKTAYLSSLIKDYPAKLLDTRKTTPGLRFLEKWAVKTGGGFNHRIGLFDMILIKDNHVDAAGGIKKAINKVQDYLESRQLKLKIEIEVRNFKELEEVLSMKTVDRVLIDNFEPAQLAEAVKRVAGSIETEASGGITQENIQAYAQSGVDFISSGSLTNSVRSLDLSLKVIK